MQKRKLSVKIVSLLLTLSILVSTFSIFAFADENDTDVSEDTLNVVYNRTFEEGWDYDNGIFSMFAQGNKVGVAYEYTGSSYNHYLRLDKLNTNVGYVHIDTAELSAEGKSFVQMDIMSPSVSAFGQAVRVSVQGSLKTLVEFKADGMYVLGTNVGRPAYEMQWQTLAFEFDFDYDADLYKVSAYHFSELVAEVEWARPAGGFGISQIRFSFGNILSENVGAWYGIDNLRVYSGSDAFSAIGEGVYGSAVDANAEKDDVLVTKYTDPDGYIRGEGKIERVEIPGGLVNHYNRHFGEGWTVNQASSAKPLQLSTKGNDIDIKGERGSDGKANYYLRYRALNDKSGSLIIPVSGVAGSVLRIELDLKAGVNADLGGILMVSGNGGAEYPIEILDGQLVLGGKPVGYIGTEWVHIAMELNSVDKTCTVHFGKSGTVSFELAVGNVTEVSIGSSGGSELDSIGDWFGIDDLQIYSGVDGFVTLPADDFGTSVDAGAPADLLLESVVVPDLSVTPDGQLPDSGDGGAVNTPVVNYDSEEMLSGSPDLHRVDAESDTWVRYNRHYGEGWDYDVGGNFKDVGDVIIRIENEKGLDLNYNYYEHYEANTTTGGRWTITTGTGSPKEGKMFVEFDFRAVEGCDLGGLIMMRQADSPHPYILGCSDGYVWVFNAENKIGRVNETDWVHFAFEFDFDYFANDEANANYYMITVYFGDNRCFQQKQQRGGSVFGISQLRIGIPQGATDATVGQYWNLDNLQVYGGTETFANLPEDNYGNIFTGNEPKDFPIQTGGTPFDAMIAESLFMKIGSEYTYANATRKPTLVDEETGDVYGAPVEIDGVVWVPLDTILNFLSYPIYVHEDGQSFDISTGATITYITLGRNTAIVAGEKVDLYAAPAIVPGEHDYLAVSINDLGILFPEFHVLLDSMNMITFSKHEAMVGEVSDSAKINSIMKNFLFDYIDADEVYERARENTNNFDHPYIFANQQKWDEIHEVWLAGRLAEDSDPTNDVPYDKAYYEYIDKNVQRAINSEYNKYSSTSIDRFTWDGERFGGLEYEGLNAESFIFDHYTHSQGLAQPYPEHYGYPYVGSLTIPSDGLMDLAMAYQITRDERLALVAYDWVDRLADWLHWSPAHFLDCADTASNVAITYDWCYDAWVSLGLDTDKIADAIYYHAVLQAYLVTIGKPDPHGASGSGSPYPMMVNNWNAVCTSGISRAVFAILDYDGFSENTRIYAPTAPARAKEYGGANMLATSSYVLAANFKSLVNIGIDIYAPDGSYEESVSYWTYGAQCLFSYSATLKSVLGDDLGIMDTWGIDRTCYSVLHMVSSDWHVFEYNDSNGGIYGNFQTTYFPYVADRVGDNALNAIRKMHIAAGRASADLWDILYYVDDTDDVELKLQYHHIGIHGYTVRSSWEQGAIFAGLLGGDNNDGHGHIDAGQWIYYNKGIRFIVDIRGDNYNAYKYFSNNHMYKTTTEGHNVICVVSDQVKLPAGQERHSVSPVVEVYDNEHGAYAITDCTPAFNGTLTSARRGILFTNDRNTVIIQDEILPYGAQEIYWFAHYDQNQVVDVEISEDGRTAYLKSAKSPIDAKQHTCRMTIVSPLRRGIQFGIMDTYTFTLDATMRPGKSEEMGAQPEHDRSNFKKLYINLKDLSQFNFAVVIEVIDPDNPIPVGYTFTNMSEWEPYADTRQIKEDIREELTVRSSAVPSELVGGVDRIDKLVDEAVQFEELGSFYVSITNITYVVNSYTRNYFERNSRYAEYLAKYDDYLIMYNAYINDIDKTTSHISAITAELLGAS